jgi:hypothetical protein
MTVPGASVTSVGAWQVPQPIPLNTCSPDLTSGVWVPRGGAFNARMNAAKILTPSPLSSGSGTVSYCVTSFPETEFSVGRSGLVMPISFRYASAANDSRLPCWLFHPKRPIRVRPACSRIGTVMARWLCVANGGQGAVRHGLDVTRAEDVR